MKRLEIIYIVCIQYFFAKKLIFIELTNFYLYVSNKNSIFFCLKTLLSKEIFP